MSDSTQVLDSNSIQVTLQESRKFNPPSEFANNANVKAHDYPQIVKRASSSPENYWKDAAGDLHWFKKFDQVLKWDPPHAQWFIGGKINAAFNCLDRHLEQRGEKTAFVWEGEPGEVVRWSYRELHAEVERFTACLRALGLHAGDRVAIYMPLIPEAIVAMLACARGGFTHTVVFAGFSAEALKDRIQDAKASCVITADGGYRKGNWIQLKESVDTAVDQCGCVQNVVIAKRNQAGERTSKRARAGSGGSTSSASTESHRRNQIPQWDYHQMMTTLSAADVKANGGPAELDSEHPLYILYTSGTTGKPKGIVHSTGGYLTGVLRTCRDVFDLKDDDLYWCTADIGWVTGHSYVVYGPLAAGASIFVYEGNPTHPKADRFWEMIERHKISILYTAPTAIRAFMKLGDEHPKAHDLRSLRLLGTVGEPINPEAWMWYRKTIGGDRCPVVDTYWQTETGAIVVSPLPGVTPTKPGSATKPLPGYDVEVVDRQGSPVSLGQGGYLVIRKPWPSMARTIHGDPARFQKQYFSEFSGGIYFTGDGARKDEDGYIWCLGRVDDVLNVSGHRLGTMEIESALVSHSAVAEAAVVGRPDEIKGQAVVAFVTLKSAELTQLRKDGSGRELKAMAEILRGHVVKEIGALARPDDIRFAEALPKTRSGKIMRRLLREIAATGKVTSDTTTLEDFTVVAALQKEEE